MDDDQLKRLRSSLDETVFKDQHFTEKNKQAVLNQIKQIQMKSDKPNRTMDRWGAWFKPVLSAAFCLILLVGIFYMLGKNSLMANQRGGERSATHSSNPAKPKSPAPPSMREVTAVRLASPKVGWTGGKGWIAKTTDGGADWVIQYQTNQTIRQIFALNDQKVWAVLSSGGTSSKLIHSNDGGKNWILSGIVPNDGFLHFTSQTGETALSANVETQDGGRSWSALPIPQNTIGQAYFHDKNTGWAVTYSKQTMDIEKTNNGGQTWNSVMKVDHVATLQNAVIRSAGKNDAWVELIGNSGSSQTSYSIFHTIDGGNTWIPVVANSTTAGNAPGFGQSPNVSHNAGSAPGAFYVANSNVAFLGGVCEVCGQPNTMGWTTDGGKTWQNGTVHFDGNGSQLLAIADGTNGWWITNDTTKPAVMYTTSDGGLNWNKVHSFK